MVHLARVLPHEREAPSLDLQHTGEKQGTAAALTMSILGRWRQADGWSFFRARVNPTSERQVSERP